MIRRATARLWALQRWARRSPPAGRTVALLRLLLGFAFVPAGLKKVLGQPFHDGGRVGPFYDFLDALQATGGFYRAIGGLQLLAAALLWSQRFAGLGALLAWPLFSAILLLCWSTAVYPTAIAVSLMWLGTISLLLFDCPRPRRTRSARTWRLPRARLNERRWASVAAAIAALYLGVCALTGGVYRPRGAAAGEPWSAVFALMLAVVAAAWWRDRRDDVPPRA